LAIFFFKRYLKRSPSRIGCSGQGGPQGYYSLGLYYFDRNERVNEITGLFHFLVWFNF
jgi:hypothetical protein